MSNHAKKGRIFLKNTKDLGIIVCLPKDFERFTLNYPKLLNRKLVNSHCPSPQTPITIPAKLPSNPAQTD